MTASSQPVFICSKPNNTSIADFQQVNAGWEPSKKTQRKKTPSYKTAALTKSINMEIWVVRTLNQLFTRGSKVITKLTPAITIALVFLLLNLHKHIFLLHRNHLHKSIDYFYIHQTFYIINLNKNKSQTFPAQYF